MAFYLLFTLFQFGSDMQKLVLSFFFFLSLHNLCTEAVADANKAIELEPSMAKAYLRKGYVFFTL